MEAKQKLDDNAGYRLLALDLDGTTVGHDFRVPEELVETLAAFREQGGYVTIATGRTFRTTLPYARELGTNAPLICYQGALIRDPQSAKTLFHLRVPGELAAEAAGMLLRAGVYVHAYVDDELVVPYEGEETAYYRSFSTIHLPTTVVDDLPAYLREHPPTKLLFIAGEHAVGDHLAGLRVHFAHRLSIARSHATFGELTAPGATKGRALAWLANELGVSQAAVAAAGDQGNDVDMVAWAGLGMAVTSGPPELLAAADVLIGTPEENGLADGVRRYVLRDT